MEESPIANNCMYRKDLYGYKQPKFDIVDFNPVNSNEQWESYFLAEEKLDILGNPIPRMKEDFDWSAEIFSFEFELGLAPEFKVDLKIWSL